MSNEIGTAIFGLARAERPFFDPGKRMRPSSDCRSATVSAVSGEQDQSAIIAVVRWVECGLDDTADFVVT